MTTQRKDRAEWIQRRVEQAYAAAEEGEGWGGLSQLWGVSKACALQWSRGKVPEEITAKIARNGNSKKHPNKGRKYAPQHSRPPVVIYTLKPRPTYETCVKLSYTPGAGLTECGNPSDGHPYCQQCTSANAAAPVGMRYPSVGFSVFNTSRSAAAA